MQLESPCRRGWILLHVHLRREINYHLLVRLFLIRWSRSYPWRLPVQSLTVNARLIILQNEHTRIASWNAIAMRCDAMRCNGWKMRSKADGAANGMWLLVKVPRPLLPLLLYIQCKVLVVIRYPLSAIVDGDLARLKQTSVHQEIKTCSPKSLTLRECRQK